MGEAGAPRPLVPLGRVLKGAALAGAGLLLARRIKGGIPTGVLCAAAGTLARQALTKKQPLAHDTGSGDTPPAAKADTPEEPAAPGGAGDKAGQGSAAVESPAPEETETPDPPVPPTAPTVAPRRSLFAGIDPLEPIGSGRPVRLQPEGAPAAGSPPPARASRKSELPDPTQEAAAPAPKTEAKSPTARGGKGEKEPPLSPASAGESPPSPPSTEGLTPDEIWEREARATISPFREKEPERSDGNGGTDDDNDDEPSLGSPPRTSMAGFRSFLSPLKDRSDWSGEIDDVVLGPGFCDLSGDDFADEPEPTEPQEDEKPTPASKKPLPEDEPETEEREAVAAGDTDADDEAPANEAPATAAHPFFDSPAAGAGPKAPAPPEFPLDVGLPVAKQATEAPTADDATPAPEFFPGMEEKPSAPTDVDAAPAADPEDPAVLELGSASRGLRNEEGKAPRGRRKGAFGWIVAALIVLAAVATALWILRPDLVERGWRQLSQIAPDPEGMGFVPEDWPSTPADRQTGPPLAGADATASGDDEPSLAPVRFSPPPGEDASVPAESAPGTPPDRPAPGGGLPAADGDEDGQSGEPGTSATSPLFDPDGTVRLTSSSAGTLDLKGGATAPAGSADVDHANPASVLRSFVEAPTIDAMAALALDREPVGPAMHTFYEKDGFVPGRLARAAVEMANEAPGNTAASRLYVVTLEGHPHTFPVAVEETDDGFRIDWEAYIQCKDDLLGRFVEEQPESPARFYVVLKRSHYFGPDLPGTEDLICCHLSSPMPDDDGLYAFIDPASPEGELLGTRIRWGAIYFPVVELEWVHPDGTATTSPRFLRLNRIVRHSWRGN